MTKNEDRATARHRVYWRDLDNGTNVSADFPNLAAAVAAASGNPPHYSGNCEFRGVFRHRPGQSMTRVRLAR